MLNDLYIRFRSLFRRSKVEEELNDELRFHTENQAEKYMRAGMSREEARRQVRLDLAASIRSKRIATTHAASRSSRRSAMISATPCEYCGTRRDSRRSWY